MLASRATRAGCEGALNPRRRGCSVHTSQIAARIPSPACWGRWRRRASKDARLSTGYGAGWGVARCYDARRLARTLPRTCGPSALLSTPHPSPSATPSPLRGEGGARRPPAGSMTCVNVVGSGPGAGSSPASGRRDSPPRFRLHRPRKQRLLHPLGDLAQIGVARLAAGASRVEVVLKTVALRPMLPQEFEA